MTLISTLAALGMAFGAPLIYADQAWSIQKRRNAEGFSKDVCAVLLVANICRIFFWFGERFEFALLLQSILLIVSQLYLLHLLLKFRPGSFASSAYSVASGDRGTSARPQQPSASQRSTQTQATTVTDFSVDDEEAEQQGRGPRADAHHQKTTTPSTGAALGDLFTGTGSARYAPLFGNVRLPMAPTLDDDDGDVDDDGSRSQRRGLLGGGALGRRAVRFVQGGLRRQEGGTRRDGSSGSRPFGFWTWPDYTSYLIFLGILVVLLAALQLVLGGLRTYVGVLGFIALGLESTLPVPQAIKNYKRKSLSGLRLSVLIGWTGGDAFKSVYFIAAGSPIQFLVCGLFTLVIDVIICAQLYMYREQTARDDESARLADAEALEAGRRAEAPIEDDGQQAYPPQNTQRKPTTGAAASRTAGQARHDADHQNGSSQFMIEADDEDDDDDYEADLGKPRR